MHWLEVDDMKISGAEDSGAILDIVQGAIAMIVEPLQNAVFGLIRCTLSN